MNPKAEFSSFFVNLRCSMDSSSVSNRLDIFEVYRRYCEVISQEYAIGGDGYRPANGSKKAKLHRNALSQLLELVESRVDKRMPMLEELPILMSRLDLMVDSCEFSRFYNFAFFICREDGQRSIIRDFAQQHVSKQPHHGVKVTTMRTLRYYLIVEDPNTRRAYF